MDDLSFIRPTNSGGIITFSQRGEAGEVVLINTTDAAGQKSWWVGLTKDEAQEAMIYLAKCLRTDTEKDNG